MRDSKLKAAVPGVIPNNGCERASGKRTTDLRWYARADVEWPVVVKTFDAVYDAKTLNISPVGAFIVCPSPPRLSETVDLIIKVPGMVDPLEVTANVVWSTRTGCDQRRERCGMGVRFESISDAERARIGDATRALLAPQV